MGKTCAETGFIIHDAVDPLHPARHLAALQLQGHDRSVTLTSFLTHVKKREVFRQIGFACRHPENCEMMILRERSHFRRQDGVDDLFREGKT
ncbi:hypothetical protein N5W20_04470 [Candidatus Kirkpatrickella diaphorinae]|uniref:Uncharacterized protein n=1 Tax=Candidatus Kirkpatrickella diaphorinae TaxID=2984322 RepID=A0ABY6GKP6_9PROT|nr:hypothetical protein [Candidatus Kirkpatrickella diaphorinae]UYH52113.1 hypothetical protein N5W20_04470 [Candidatus Kirkpatrickella diaphorinae]